MIRFKFNKPQLDALATLVGLIGGIASVFALNDVGDKKMYSTIAGVSTVLLGYLANKPAAARPTTEEVEEEEIK